MDPTSTTTPPRPRAVAIDGPRPDRAGTLTLLTILAGTFMGTLDLFIVNVAVPSIQVQLHAPGAVVQWVVSGYSLAIGLLVVVGGRCGERYGTRRVYGVGLAAFAITSAVCGLAWNADVLIAARIAQGAAAAVMLPQALATMRMVFTGKALVRGFTAYGLIMGLAAVFGQMIGGALISLDILGLGWRSCFLINVPVGVIALLALTRRVPPTPARGRNHGRALLDLSIFRVPRFALAIVGQAAFGAALSGFFFVFSLYSQTALELGPLSSGVLFGAIGLGYIATSSLAGRVQRRLGRHTVIVGAAVLAVGLIALIGAVEGIAVGSAPSTVTGAVVLRLVPGLMLTGAGMGLVIGPLASLAMGSVHPEQAGSAAGTVSTVMQLAGALGVALVGTVLGQGEGPAAAPFVVCLVILIGLSALTAVAVGVAGRRRRGEVER